MAYRDRVQELAALVVQLDGAGVVHHRLRLVNDWAVMIQQFRDPATSRFNGWMITRRAIEPASPRVQETYVLTKIRGINDAEESDLDLQEHLDRAVALFRDQADLTFGTVLGGLKVPLIEPRMFGSVLCHVADCELVVDFYYHQI